MINKRSNSLFKVLISFVLTFGLVFTGFMAFSLLKSYNYAKDKYKKNPEVFTDKPSYEYLKSTSVYIFQDMGVDLDGNKIGAIGSGTIVADKNGEFYILTNKHVCDEENKGMCYVILNDKQGINTKDYLTKSEKYLLTYVKHGDSNHDLAIWKIKDFLLTGKKVIIGLNTVNIQDKVYSVGQYLGFPYIYTEGTKAGVTEDGELFNLPSTHGCSGSGIFNSKGELVAVIYAGYSSPTTLPIIASSDTAKSVAIEGKYVEEFLKEYFNE